ncbi:MAG: RHS repeat domain-containing protein, partial [Prosthecobacter sp.]
FATGTGLAGSAVNRTFLWGPDLSGSMTGAGGVGGLLSTTYQGITYQVCSDANGNVTCLVPVSGTGAGTLVARFDYDPFGNRVTNAGPNVELCPFGFSSKYLDGESGMINYGFRSYSISKGRFISRDLLEESGGLNLQRFTSNDPVNNLDYLGNCPCRVNYFNGTGVIWQAETGFFINEVAITLRVKFRLKVEDKEACIIDQQMKGDAPGFNSSADWVIDHDEGKDWWDGKSWNSGVGNIGRGHPKSIHGWLPSGLSGGKDETVFFDDPGFWHVPVSSFPRWMGAFNGQGNGFYKFKTRILNREDREVVQSYEWGIRIFCPAGAKSHHGCTYKFIGLPFMKR